jgi:hypothetical protein
MKIRRSLYRAMVCAGLLACTGATGVRAQNAAVRPRVTQTVDDAVTVRLHGNVHPLAKPGFDQGALPDSQPLTRMLLVLQRSAEQELALRQLLDAQVTKNSGNYHAWLTPDQFGKQFGPSDSDVLAVTDWLTKQGFTIRKVAAGRTAIEFDGNVAQVRNAFHTEMHRFVVNGEQHFANVSDPAIPQALSSVVAGVAALHNFPKHSYVTRNGVYRRYRDSGKLEPLFTFGNPASYAIGPGDFRTIYNVPSSADGTGQAIAIMSDSNINTADVVSYRTMFGLPAYSSVCTSALPPSCQFSVIVNGPDPGLNGDEVEADLDTQLAGGVAPNAAIYLVVTGPTVSNPTQVSQGVDLSALFAVDNNLAPVISNSFGECESGILMAGNQFYNALWEQAAAQGITVAVATGDNGSAACDPSTDPNAATQGLAVSGLASTPFNVAVGGTDFDPTSTTTSVSTYWKPNTSGDVINSALTYIPETTWNDSPCAANYPAACTTLDSSGNDISAGSGGPSNCILGTVQGNGSISCPTSSSFPNGGYLKPAFQTGITPNDSVRDIPDVSFFSSNGGLPSGGAGVAYVICQSDTNPQGATTPTGAACSLASPYTDFSLVGGTSAATPAFAAVMAMVNQTTGQRQGNANYVLYKLAADASLGNYTGGGCQSSVGQTPASGCVFNDVTKGNISVACDGGTPNCSNTNTAGGFGVLVCNSPGCNPNNYPNGTGVPAFKAAPGYDLATGLGSINVGNLLKDWALANRNPTTTTLSSPSGGSPSGSNFTATVTVSPAPTGPVENVSLIALASDGKTVLGSFGPFALSSGSATVTTNLLPPGTANVEGSYGGDADLAASTSGPVALSSPVSGANQPSTLTVYYVGFNSSGAPTTPMTSSQNFVYGSGNGYILKIVVTGPSGPCAFSQPATKPAIPCPTGTIQLFDGGQPLKNFTQNGTATNQASLNNQGFAEDQPINVNAGTHNITATYSGDPNYAPTSTSNTLTITITQASTATALASSLSSIMPGTSVTLTATVNSTSGSPQGPSGSVAFTNNGNSLGSGTCTPTGATSSAGALCTATLTVAISALYPPPSGRPAAPNFPGIPVIVALVSLLLFLLGLRLVPQTRRRAYAYAGLLAIALLVGVVAGCGGGGGGSNGGSGTRTIGAAYSGDTNYKASTAPTLPIIVQ